MTRRLLVAAALALGIVSGSLAAPWNAGPGAIFTPVATVIARTLWTESGASLSNAVRTFWTEDGATQ